MQYKASNMKLFTTRHCCKIFKCLFKVTEDQKTRTSSEFKTTAPPPICLSIAMSHDELLANLIVGRYTVINPPWVAVGGR